MKDESRNELSAIVIQFMKCLESPEKFNSDRAFEDIHCTGEEKVALHDYKYKGLSEH